MPSVTDRISDRRDALTPAERRVAEAVLDDPQSVAFGTVAGLAERAGTSGPTVVRASTKLGFDGFGGLQAAVQEEIAGRLRPAAELIRRPLHEPLGRALVVEAENVRATLEGLDPKAFAAAVALLADARRRVAVLSGDSSFGVALLFGEALSMMRDNVEVVSGSQVRVARRLASVRRGDVVVAMDVRRYDRWLLEAAARARSAGARLVAVTDSVLSPLADGAAITFVVDAQGIGPFDSHVGTLALANALAAGVAADLRRSAASRLDRIEGAWRASGALSKP